MKLPPLAALVISVFLALMVVFVVDPLDPSTFSTPFCLGMILMWYSLRQTAWVVLCVAICYCFIDFYATTWFLGRSPGPVPHPYFWFFQRFGLFFVVALMAVYLSYHREQTDKNIDHIRTVLSKLPAPVVISDAAGYITYVNEALCAFFGQTSENLIGKRYPELLMTNIEEGKAMRYYIELFAEDNPNAPEVDLATSVNASNVKAGLTCLGKGKYRSMITVLQTASEEKPVKAGR